MSILKRSSLCVLACTGAALAILMSSAPSAESKAPTMVELLTGCAQRVEELEAEVELLREQLAEQRASSAARHSEVASFDDVPGMATAALPECEIPFHISKSGIKQVKRQCLDALQTLSPCDIPFEVDRRGVKRFKPHCL